MKILFNCLTLRKGGAERVINILTNDLVKDNDIMIVSNMYGKVEYDFDERIKIKFLAKEKDNKVVKKLRRISPFMLFKLKNIITNYNPDVIISFLPEPNFRVLFLKKVCKKLRKIPTIISVRNDPNTEYGKKIYYYIMKKLYPLANQIVLQTEDAKNYFVDNINFSGVVIPNPVDNQFMVEKYNGKREKRIVAVGRLEKQKNYFNMIDAFEIFNEKYPDYILDIYGEGNLRNTLQDYINNKGLNEKIILNGKVDDIKDKIYKASAFVMSSDYEGMPNALLEANCLGVPCISTNCPCGGPRDILDDGKCGILVEVNNPKELANGIIHLIENKAIAEDYSKAAQKKSNRYLEKEVVKRWLQEIEKERNDGMI